MHAPTRILAASLAVLALACSSPTDPGTALTVTGVTLSTNTLSLAIGGSTTLAATVLPIYATNKGVSWKSNAPSVASVSAAGLIQGLAAGRATITVTTIDQGKTAACEVTVSESGGTLVTGVTLSKTDLSLAVGGYETLTATVAPEGATTTSLTWTSDDPSVATVAEGMVRGVKAGSTVIRVTTTDQGKTATCTVTVGSTVSGVALDKTTLSLVEGDSDSLVATVAPDDASNKAVTWSSDAESVATVDAEGKVSAVKAGTATITVTTADQAKTATCAVTVADAKVAEVKKLVGKLPALKIVAPNSLAARSGSSRGLTRTSRAVAESEFALFPPATPSYADASKARDFALSALELLDLALSASNGTIDVVKLKLDAAKLTSLDTLIEGSWISSTQYCKYNYKLSALASGGYRIANTNLNVYKDSSTGAWGGPYCTWHVVDVSENGAGQVAMTCWSATSTAAASSGSLVTSEGATYVDQDFLQYDEASGMIAFFNKSSIDDSYDYYKGIESGGETIVFIQSEIAKDTEKTDSYTYLRGDDTDGLVSYFFRFDEATDFSGMLEDYFTTLDGNAGTFIGGARSHADQYLDYANLPAVGYEWPLDLLSLTDMTAQLVRYGSSIYSYSFFLTPIGVTASSFDPASASYTAFPYLYMYTSPLIQGGSSDNKGKITAYSDSGSQLCYADDRQSASFQPAANFTYKTQALADTATTLAGKAGDWLGTHKMADMAGFASGTAHIDMASCPIISFDTSTIAPARSIAK